MTKRTYYEFRGIRFKVCKDARHPYEYVENPNICFATKEDAQNWVIREFFE